jgi:septum formation protein
MKPVISERCPLVLASNSAYRAELLRRLGVPFAAVAPNVNEQPLAGETPANLAQRLAISKAQLVARQHPEQWTLGCDQVPSLDGQALAKPGTRDNALAQLQAFSNRSVLFHTAVALVGGGQTHTALDTTVVRFRPLERAEIERYLEREVAYDCAGAFKAEGLGVTLFTAIETRDPTALIGLPLIAVRQLLAQAGYPLP